MVLAILKLRVVTGGGRQGEDPITLANEVRNIWPVDPDPTRKFMF